MEITVHSSGDRLGTGLGEVNGNRTIKDSIDLLPGKHGKKFVIAPDTGTGMSIISEGLDTKTLAITVNGCETQIRFTADQLAQLIQKTQAILDEPDAHIV